MHYAPLARIAIRYGVGLVLGAETGDLLAGDVDVVAVVAAGIGIATEFVYAMAVKRGWAK